MENIPLGLAKKILQLSQGEVMAGSQVKSKWIDNMIAEGVLQLRLHGRTRRQIFANNPVAIHNYLSNNLGINDLHVYIQNLESGQTRAENILATSNSKSSNRRTFKGFPVNTYQPIAGSMNGHRLTILPQEGTYTYIHDFESFNIPTECLVIGIENPENFKYINQQRYLFAESMVLFVSRYPQSKDLVNWLQQIPNLYLHFGDFDFEGIRIFRDEYQCHLSDRASFFIPSNVEDLINRYGNKALYNKQFTVGEGLSLSKELQQLIALFHKYKKCLEQEVLIRI